MMEMESVILKFICANNGAVTTEHLECELGTGASTDDFIGNKEKFALCCPFGQQKVVVRTGLRLCRTKDCPGSCRELHLCKKFLFTGSCPYTKSRNGCRFSHCLDSCHNAAKLREHGLETLNRTELCTLLLQNDNFLLPPICYDYNNGDGEFGQCKDGFNCTRIHICEKYLNHDCSCPKTHDFTALQPQKSLQSRLVPDDLLGSLKSVYANISALKYVDRKGNKGNRHPNSTASSDDGLNLSQKQWYRGRGRGGNRGNRGNRGGRGNKGNRGNHQQQQRPGSSDAVFVDIDSLDLYSEDGINNWLKSSTSGTFAASNDTDASSEDGRNRNKNPSKTSTAGRGRGGNRGNRGNLATARSYSDIFAAVNDDTKSEDGAKRRQRPVRDKTEICMYFIKGHCIHEEKCFKAHDKMPYRWEVREDGQWKALPDNETIEKDYCDPKNSYSSSSSPPVHFDTMTRGSDKVRRLSTMNSLLEPNFIHTTEWLWYWEDEFGEWNMYAAAAVGGKVADVDSSILEQKFLDNDKDVVEFTAGSQSYSLSFPDMIQTNKKYGTKRLVKRRPQFVSAADVKTMKPKKNQSQSNFSAVPDHWDKTKVPQTGYTRVSLERSSDEFKEIETLFCRTMRGFDIVKIERIQNKPLWEVFQWQKCQMKNNNNGRYAAEKKLFHGTDPKYVDAICHNNFDWRKCGTNGTVYGEGSYFARDAKYSHSYTGESDVKSLFIARVLVGYYTKGYSTYRRPPSKDGGDINFYDSCVNDVMDPSIFVVFEKHQIYPEYLLQYKTTHPLVDLYASVPTPTPAPAPTPKPVPAPRPATQPMKPTVLPTVSVYQSSASVSQSSTPSYQPTVSISQSSTTSYSPPPVPQRSSPSYSPPPVLQPLYKPSTLSYQPSRAVTPPPRYSPPTSLPKAKPKTSSDSCVIA